MVCGVYVFWVLKFISDNTNNTMKLTTQNKPIKQLAITAYDLKTVTGNRDFALFGAVAAMLATATEDSNQEVPSIDNEGYDPALISAIPEFDGIDPEFRMLQNLQNVILNAAEHLLEKQLQEKRHLVLIIIPASVDTRSDYIDSLKWQEIIATGLTEFSDLHYRFINADDNVTKHLQSACQAINEEKIESVMFAGIDSLVDQATCQELIQQNRLCSSTISDGVIPGEAAACVVIQNIDITRNTPRGIIKGLTFSAEPNCGKAHTSKMTGLSQAIQNVSQTTGQHPDAIDCVIRNNSREQQYSLEWYQTTQSIWPNKLPEQERVAYQLGEIDEPPELKPRKMPEELFTGLTLGEIGAATLPISLILACARFEFNYPMVKNCLVCEANEFPFRGAILVENPQPKTPEKA